MGAARRCFWSVGMEQALLKFLDLYGSVRFFRLIAAILLHTLLTPSSLFLFVRENMLDQQIKGKERTDSCLKVAVFSWVLFIYYLSVPFLFLYPWAVCLSLYLNINKNILCVSDDDFQWSVLWYCLHVETRITLKGHKGVWPCCRSVGALGEGCYPRFHTYSQVM